jgi:DNA-binding CsgD family transcriptional regulator
MPSSSDHHAQDFSRVVDELDGSISRALDRLPLPIWITDRSGRIRWLNPTARNVLGSIPGRHFSGLIAPESLNEFRDAFARTILGASDLTVRPVTLLGQEGRLTAELAAVPLEVESLVVGVLTLAWIGGTQSRSAGKRPQPRLTPRQHEVLELLAHGYATARIAAELSIADETARNHIRLLLAELGVHTRLEAVVVAFRNGWL